MAEVVHLTNDGFCSGIAGTNQLDGLQEAMDYLDAAGGGQLIRDAGSVYGIDPNEGHLIPRDNIIFHGAGQIERVGEYVTSRLPDPSKRFIWAENSVQNFSLIGVSGIDTFIGHGQDVLDTFYSAELASDTDADDPDVTIHNIVGTVRAASRMSVGGAVSGIFSYTSATNSGGGNWVLHGCTNVGEWTTGAPLNEFIGNLGLACFRLDTTAGSVNEGCEMMDVTFDNWPGPSTALVGVTGGSWRGITFNDCLRGGLIFWLHSANNVVETIRATENHDDILALHALAAGTTTAYGQLSDFWISDVIGSEAAAADQQTNNGIVLNGARAVALRDCHITGAGSERGKNKAGLVIRGAVNSGADSSLIYSPRDIDVDDCTFAGSNRIGINLHRSPAADNIRIGPNVEVSDSYEEAIHVAGLAAVEEDDPDEDVDVGISPFVCDDLEITARVISPNLSEGGAPRSGVSVEDGAHVRDGRLRILGEDPDARCLHLILIEGDSNLEVAYRATRSHYQGEIYAATGSGTREIIPWPEGEAEPRRDFVGSIE